MANTSARKTCDSLSQESQESRARLLRLLRQTIAFFLADVHNVFHVSLLEPHHQNQMPLRKQTRPKSEEIEGEKEYEVEKNISSEIRITRRRVKGKNKVIKKLFYLVKWKGYPEDECTWEPGEHLTHADDEIETFHRQNPNAPTIELS